MQATVTFYGRLKADVGARETTLHLPGDRASVQAVVAALLDAHPVLAAQLETIAFTIGAELVTPDATVQDGDTVGLLPPVSGG